MFSAAPRPSSPIRNFPRCRSIVRHSCRGIVVCGGTRIFSRIDRGREDYTAPRPFASSVVSIEGKPGHDELRLDRLQPPDLENRCRLKRVFGRFVAREALLEEELWTASWLRAESHYEDQPYLRYVKNYKKMFAEQEFAALKRRCNPQNAEKCICIVVVKREDKDVKRTVLNSVVASLDLSVRLLLRGEAYPSDRAASSFSNVYREDGAGYGYIGNLSVAKCARRQGIASNMLYLAVEAAKSEGIDQVFVHVDRENTAARKLYEKLGFEVVDLSPCTEPVRGQRLLMILKC
ncbi:GCN5-related N-acetyltransferase 6, chloroplastic-like isoform X1 [Wolffia australiana]